MDRNRLAREAREQRRLEVLNSIDPRCGMCGEKDSRCLEEHHVADLGRDDTTVILCRNCHRKVSDDQKDHPTSDPAADPLLDSIGHFLLGLTDMLRVIVEKVYEFGLALIARAASCNVGGKR